MTNLEKAELEFISNVDSSTFTSGEDQQEKSAEVGEISQTFQKKDKVPSDPYRELVEDPLNKVRKDPSDRQILDQPRSEQLVKNWKQSV